MSGQLPPFASDPLSVDRMMAIGQTFERQGRFGQAQLVYQQILEVDPVSPAAERLLTVIAAAEVTNAQNLPVERLMSVGEFYERHGNIPLAQGVYSQILQRQPDFRPARDRLSAIALHQVQKPGAAFGVKQVATARDSGAILRQIALNSKVQQPVPEVDRQPSEMLEANYETGVTGADSNPQSVQLTNAEDSVIPVAADDAFIPPSPSDLAPNSRPSSTVLGGPTPNPDVGSQSADVWQEDMLIGQLKASIAVKSPELKNLRDSEVIRPPSKAKGHLLEQGQYVHSIGQSRQWLLTSYEWEAPATRHLPLFFEEPNLERMGYTYGLYWNICGCQSGQCAAECLQPFASGLHFFGRVAGIPYICGIDPPLEPVYTLGVDRPGSPVPYRKCLIPLSIKGVIYQCGVMTGLAYLP